MQCATHLNLGHAIQVINQGAAVPPPIVPQTAAAGSALSQMVSQQVGWLCLPLLALVAAVH